MSIDNLCTHSNVDCTRGNRSDSRMKPNRRTFLGFLASIPFLGFLNDKPVGVESTPSVLTPTIQWEESPVFNLKGIPLPIIHKDFCWPRECLGNNQPYQGYRADGSPIE